MIFHSFKPTPQALDRVFAGELPDEDYEIKRYTIIFHYFPIYIRNKRNTFISSVNKNKLFRATKRDKTAFY